MIEEAYCNPEIAELLKEKGMDKGCFTHYIQKNNSDGTSEAVTTCTQQMAMRWLREVHNIHIDICSIWDTTHWLYQVFVITPRTARNSYADKILYTSYEQACEAAIKYCLEHLIFNNYGNNYR